MAKGNEELDGGFQKLQGSLWNQMINKSQQSKTELEKKNRKKCSEMKW